MLAQGFLPDCISSDVHALCIEGPAFDLLTTMSKFLCLGVDLGDAVRAATEAPAKALRRDDLGSLRPGLVGEASIFALKRGTFDYVELDRRAPDRRPAPDRKRRGDLRTLVDGLTRQPFRNLGESP